MDEDFYTQLEIAPMSQALVLVGLFNYHICWRRNTVKLKQSKRFLESVNDNFLSQGVEDPTRNVVLLEPHTNKQGMPCRRCEGWGQPWLL